VGIFVKKKRNIIDIPIEKSIYRFWLPLWYLQTLLE